jgi:prepilin-type processing-associated H-X9-DG protein
MNPRFWSFRMFAALWGLLFAPLAPSLADELEIVRSLPADTLAYVAWAEPYQPGDIELAQLEQFAQQTAGADFGQLELTGIGELIGLLTRAAQHPGGLALLDLTTTAGTPDVQLALLIAADNDAITLADGLAGFIKMVASDAEIGTTEVGGALMRRLAIPETPLVVYWGVHKGHFVATLGERAAERIVAGLDGKESSSLASSAELKFARSKLGRMDGDWRVSAFGDARAMVARIRALVEQLHGPLPPVVDKVIEALGINGVRSKYFRMHAGEQGLLGRLFVHVDGERKGILKLWAQQPLSEDDLQIIPKDAYWAQVWNLDLQQLWDDTRETIEEVDPNAVPMVEGVLAMSGTFLGLSLTEQVLPAFGDTWAVFDAPSHGGVLLTGSVLVVEVRDADAIQALMTRLVGLLQPMLASEDVNLTLRQTTCDGRTIHHVVVGGVPCPVAPAWTFVNDRMVFGLFPQTVAVAARQVDPQTRGESILDHPAVEHARRNVFPSRFQSFGCSDAKYFARLVYPFGLLYSTLGVSMLSVPGVELDPMMYPGLSDALAEVHYSVGMCATDGDGIHYAQVGSANAGLVAVAVVALLVSILLPSLSRARELAKRAVSASNLRGVGIGCQIYANDHAGRFPDRLEALIENGMITREMLVSPRDPEVTITPENREALTELGYLKPDVQPADKWSGSYVYIAGQSEKDDPRNVVAYEKIISDEGTNVLFLDGHVEWMKLDGFKQALVKTYQRLGREHELPADIRDLQP